MRPGRPPTYSRGAGVVAMVISLFVGAHAALGAQVSVSLASRAPAADAARSLVIPGWGQWHLGQRRAWAYALLEAGLWVTRLELQASGAHFRDRYRDVAWNTARIQSAPRKEGPWAYYEAMSDWTRSGAYDADPSLPGIQPEQDPSTFNGAKWALAKGLYFPPGVTPSPSDPAYQAALAYYEKTAYGTAYLWDWTGKATALTQYRDFIHRSDTRFREASATLGAVLANHLLSAVDAYISARSRLQTGLRVEPEATPGGLRWTLSAHLTGRR